MKKPEKKSIKEFDVGFRIANCEGYNQACDDWEKFLPSEEEMENIILENTVTVTKRETIRF